MKAKEEFAYIAKPFLSEVRSHADALQKLGISLIVPPAPAESKIDSNLSDTPAEKLENDGSESESTSMAMTAQRMESVYPFAKANYTLSTAHVSISTGV